MKIKSMLLISVTVFVLSACGSDSPQVVTLKYINDMGSGDFQKAENISKGPAKVKANLYEKEERAISQTPGIYKIVKSKINGAHAKIHALANNGHRLTATLDKSNGHWYVTSLRKGS